MKEFIFLYFDFSFQPSIFCFDKCLDSCTNSFRPFSFYLFIYLSIIQSLIKYRYISDSFYPLPLSQHLSLPLRFAVPLPLSVSYSLSPSLFLYISLTLPLSPSLFLCISLFLSVSHTRTDLIVGSISLAALCLSLSLISHIILSTLLCVWKVRIIVSGYKKRSSMQ